MSAAYQEVLDHKSKEPHEHPHQPADPEIPESGTDPEWEETEENLSLAPKGKGRKAAKALYKKEEVKEVAPPGWEGTVKAMKKHKEIDNPYALSWHMKKKGYKSHKKEEVEIDELTPDQKKKREASRQRTHGGSATGGSDPFKRMFHSGQRGGKKPDRASRQVWEPHPGKFKGPKGKLPEDVEIDEGEWADSKAQEKKDSDRLVAIHNKREKRYQMHQRKKREAEKKESIDTWHPDPEKDRKTTSMKHTAKAVRHHARRDKPATFARKKVTPDQIRAILDKQRARRAAQNEEIQFKVKIRDLPPFYVPGRSAGAVKQALRKQLRKPDDIESIERHTTAAKKKDFRLRAQGKEE